MKVVFLAALQGTTCVKFDDDGSGVVKLAFSADQAQEVVHVLAGRGQLLKVTVETIEE
jgi:hypothetical protein